MSDEKNNSRQDNPKPKPKSKPRRWRRFRRTMITFLLGLACIVWAGPYFASTDIAREMIISAANSHFYGTFQIDEISLNWMGPCVVKGLRVTDTSDREVLHIERIVWEHGAWRGATDYEMLGHVEVIKPKTKLIEEASGKFSLAEALKPRKPTPKKPLPELVGRITVHDANVSVVLADGTEGELSRLDARFSLNTLKDVAGEFSWGSVEMHNLVLGEATFKPTFRNEQFDLPVVEIPVSSVQPRKDAPPGFLRVGCEIDFSGPEPLLKMPGTLMVAENIPIDRELGSDVLSRTMPIFYEPQKLTVQVSLTVDDLLLPLGDSIKRTGGGHGKLILKGVKIQSQSGGLMAGLTNMSSLAMSDDLTSMKISDILFEIRDGRCYYDDLTITFASVLDMKFSGSVGFDDTLDLIVSLPILPRQLEKLTKVVSLEKLRSGIGLDVLGPLLNNLPVVGNRRHIDIRITGTRQKPRLGLPPILDNLLKPDVRPSTQPDTNPIDPLFDLLDELLKPKPRE